MTPKTLYWLSTSLISAMLLASAWSYLFHKTTIEGVRALGFPDFFRLELAVLKIVAVLILMLPAAPLLLKEWAYAGVALFLLTAIVAHWAHGDPIALNLINVAFLGLLATSRFFLSALGG